MRTTRRSYNVFFFKQKTAYEVRISDWSSDVCSSDLGELARHPAHLHHRQLRSVGEHDRHLEDDAEGVADVVGVEFCERFGTVAALEQERLAPGYTREIGGQVARLAGKDERRIAAELIGRGVERRGIGIIGKLAGFGHGDRKSTRLNSSH